ncbi:MAG: rod shape-determining protein [Acidobacteria bacterium]|nr:rod shape-determining protein [Acidobacteriota bacterium]MCW5970538.1 rod shape-determining protein [Blastocatellales bacterium]
MKLPSLLSLVTDDLAIDLGTSRTRVFARGRGIVVNEPSLLAYDQPSREVVAVGLEALELEGRASNDIQIISPLQDGVVADSTFAGKLIASYIRMARDGRSSISRRVLISIAADATDIEHYALRYAAKEAGVSNVHFINKGMVALLGSGVDPEDQRATLVVDVGAGTTTIAAMVHKHLIFSRTLRVGGNDLDAALIEMIKQNHNLLVGPRTAERVKIELGCAVPLDQEHTTMVKGRSTIAGNPDMAIVNSIEVHDAIEPVLARIVLAIQEALEALPPEASGDIYDRGMMLAGGASLLAGFDERLSKETELAVQLTESPARSVIRGLGLLFEDPLMLRRAIVKAG